MCTKHDLYFPCIACAEEGIERLGDKLRETWDEEQEHILQFFEYKHLPTDLLFVRYAFYNVAYSTVMLLPRNPERTVALRKLLEAKNAAEDSHRKGEGDRDGK